MSRPFPSKKNRRSRAFTLLELLTVIIIISILATLIYPALRATQGKAEGVRCMANMRSLHASLATYTTDKHHWPQIPPDLTGNSAELWWRTELEKYGGTPEVWKCPALERLYNENGVAEADKPLNDYAPTPFDSNPITPFKWSTMPWLAEVADGHGDGNLLIFFDGSIKTFNQLLKEQQPLPAH